MIGIKHLYVGLALLASMAPAQATDINWYIMNSHDASCKPAAMTSTHMITPDVWVDTLIATNRFLKSTLREFGNRGYEVSVEGKDNKIMFVSNLELCKYLLNEMIKAGVVRVR